MFHWRNDSVMRNVKLLFGAVLLLFSSCGFIDLRPVGVTVIPDRENTLLPDEFSPVIIRFDTEMAKQETEGILQIRSDSGAVEGDLLWRGRDLYFTPVQPWTAGIRYAINLSGTVKSADGRELRLDKYIPFYAINRSSAPLLETFSPAAGASVECGGLRLELTFSQPMEQLSTESAFSIDGVGEKKFEWSDDGMILTVTPEKPLSPWTTYRWSVKNSAKSRDGVPLPKTYSNRFCTDLDRLMPEVAAAFPVLNSGGRWLPTGGSIETALGPGQGIAVEFNKPMAENALHSLRFEPALSGRTEKISERKIVFIPVNDPDPETEYALVVSADTKDVGGLKLGMDYRILFTPDIPYLEIISINIDTINHNFINGSIIPVQVNNAGGGILRFTIHFSFPFNTEEKQNAAMKISLSPFFPGTLAPIALRSCFWIGDDRLRMEWENLKDGGADSHLYRLLIPGGRGGTGNGQGMYLKEDQYIYLEA